MKKLILFLLLVIPLMGIAETISFVFKNNTNNDLTIAIGGAISCNNGQILAFSASVYYDIKAGKTTTIPFTSSCFNSGFSGSNSIKFYLTPERYTFDYDINGTVTLGNYTVKKSSNYNAGNLYFSYEINEINPLPTPFILRVRNNDNHIVGFYDFELQASYLTEDNRIEYVNKLISILPGEEYRHKVQSFKRINYVYLNAGPRAFPQWKRYQTYEYPNYREHYWVNTPSGGYTSGSAGTIGESIFVFEIGCYYPQSYLMREFEEDFIDLKINQNKIISVYPNPATDHINIGYDLEENTELVIYSMDGKVMERTILDADINSMRIDTYNYPAGIYMYRYGNENGKFIIK